MRRIALTLGLALIAAVPSSAHAAAPAGTTPPVWAWLTARQPTATSYTPGPADQASSNGALGRVERLGRGHYIVRFANLSSAPCVGWGCSGIAFVTALSTASRDCSVSELGSHPLSIEVVCIGPLGARKDSAFSVDFLAVRDVNGILAYLWADDPSNPFYTPQAAYNVNRVTNEGNPVLRLGQGRWLVYLTDLHAGIRGNLQLDSIQARCVLEDRYDNEDPKDAYAAVIVGCHDRGGAPVDATWSLAFTDGVGIKGIGDGPAAYLFAERPRTASYRPAAAFRMSSSGRPPLVERLGVGRYRVTLPGLGRGGSAQVTQYGPGRASCQLASIRRDAGPQRIGVRCFNAEGDPVDRRFSLTWTR